MYTIYYGVLCISFMPIWILEVLIVTSRAARSDALEASGLRQTLWFSGSRPHPMLMACLSIPNDSAKKNRRNGWIRRWPMWFNLWCILHPPPFLQSKNQVHRRGEYNVYSTFQSHEPEFDYLKSLEIEEKINKIRWLPQQNAAYFLLSTNGTYKWLLLFGIVGDGISLIMFQPLLDSIFLLTLWAVKKT